MWWNRTWLLTFMKIRRHQTGGQRHKERKAFPFFCLIGRSLIYSQKRRKEKEKKPTREKNETERDGRCGRSRGWWRNRPKRRDALGGNPSGKVRAPLLLFFILLTLKKKKFFKMFALGGNPRNPSHLLIIPPLMTPLASPVASIRTEWERISFDCLMFAIHSFRRRRHGRGVYCVAGRTGRVH